MIGYDAWAVLLPADRHEAERLFHHELFELSGLDGGEQPRPGDRVLVVAPGSPPAVVALGRVEPAATGEVDPYAEPGIDPDDPQGAAPTPLVVAYTRRAFDDPLPVERLALDRAVTRLDPAAYADLAARLGPPPVRRPWLVSVSLPIEASSPPEAVRLFWSYVRELGPRELPTYVSPAGNELAMQAFVLGAEANQDPEEDD